MKLKEVEWGGMNRVDLTGIGTGGGRAGSCECCNEFGFHKVRGIS